MLNNITIGQYFPGTSPVHSLDPRTKILAVVAYIVVIFLSQGFAGFLAIAAFTLLCAAGTALGVTRMTGFFNETQRWMFLALPFLLCYDGTRGRGMGRFFYLYYPLHILALAAMAACAADFTKILPSA